MHLKHGLGRWIFLCGYILFLVALVEVTLRGYLFREFGTFSFRASTVIMRQYPVLRDAEARPAHRSADRMKVLILAASTLHPDFGDVIERVRDKMSRAGVEADFVNLSAPAFGTRDSLFQYMQLEGQTFDAILLYHGVNEVRANNAPPDVYKADYSHYAWYEELNMAVRHEMSLRYTVIPYGMDLLVHRLRQRLMPARYVPKDLPSPDWLAFGSDLKTPPAFRANIEGILAIARRRGDTPVLMSQAWYMPTNYSQEAFTRKELDYGRHVSPIELWGLPPNVVAGIKAHNQVMTELGATHAEARFIDMEREIPKDGRYFDDICHLTQAGCELFANVLAPQLVELWRSKHPPRTDRSVK